MISAFLLSSVALAQKPPALTGSELLHQAALRGHTLSVEMLLKLGVDVNVTDKHGRTALHDACLKGHVSAARLLLDRGVPRSMRAIRMGPLPCTTRLWVEARRLSNSCSVVAPTAMPVI